MKTIRESMSAMESAQIWKGRKSAFGATGPHRRLYLHGRHGADRAACPRRCAAPARSAPSYGLRVANVFHAGDGNMHPLMLYNSTIRPSRTRPRTPAPSC